MDAVAEAGGWSRRSSVQRYFKADYDPAYLPPDVTARFIKAFEGKGSPTISVSELLTLGGVPLQGAEQIFSVKDQIGSLNELPRDIPIYGTALGSEVSFDLTDGTGSIGVEQAELDQSEVLAFLRRPPALAGRKNVYGVYVSGASMYPRFKEGEAVIVDPRRPPMIDDDVIVQLRIPDDQSGERVSAVLVKRLVRRTAAYVELAQFNPPLSFRIDMARVASIHRIVTPGELLS